MAQNGKRLALMRYQVAQGGLGALRSEWTNNNARATSITQIQYPSLAGSVLPADYSKNSPGYKSYLSRLKRGH